MGVKTDSGQEVQWKIAILGNVLTTCPDVPDNPFGEDVRRFIDTLGVGELVDGECGHH